MNFKRIILIFGLVGTFSAQSQTDEWFNFIDAVRNGNANVVKTLCKRIDVNKTYGFYFWTALEYAAQAKNHVIIKTLLECPSIHIDLTKQNTFGLTAWDYSDFNVQNLIKTACKKNSLRCSKEMNSKLKTK